MKCYFCGKPLGEDDDVADIQIDLSKSERYDFCACRECVELLRDKPKSTVGISKGMTIE